MVTSALPDRGVWGRNAVKDRDELGSGCPRGKCQLFFDYLSRVRSLVYYRIFDGHSQSAIHTTCFRIGGERNTLKHDEPIAYLLKERDGPKKSHCT